MSFYKLDKLFGSCIAEGTEWKPDVSYNGNGVEKQLQLMREDIATGNTITNPFITQSSAIGTDTDGSVGGSVEPGSNIVQVTIGVLMELCVQPQQAKVSSGGGGGGNESGWDDNDNEKDKHKPRRRRR